MAYRPMSGCGLSGGWEAASGGAVAGIPSCSTRATYAALI
jgi:hypothetical protein